MVEPSDELQAVFDKSINDAKKLRHEYVTLEHLLFSMLCVDNFVKVVEGAGADPELRSGLISDTPTHLIKILSEVAVGKREKISRTTKWTRNYSNKAHN